MDSNEKMHRLMQIKQAVIEAESTPSVIRNRKVIRRRVIKKQTFGNFLMQKVGLASKPTKANCNCNSGGNQAVKYCHQNSVGSGSIIDCNSPSKENTGVAI